MEAAEMIFV